MLAYPMKSSRTQSCTQDVLAPAIPTSNSPLDGMEAEIGRATTARSSLARGADLGGSHMSDLRHHPTRRMTRLAFSRTGPHGPNSLSLSREKNTASFLISTPKEVQAQRTTILD